MQSTTQPVAPDIKTQDVQYRLMQSSSTIKYVSIFDKPNLNLDSKATDSVEKFKLTEHDLEAFDNCRIIENEIQKKVNDLGNQSNKNKLKASAIRFKIDDEMHELLKQKIKDIALICQVDCMGLTETITIKKCNDVDFVKNVFKPYLTESTVTLESSFGSQDPSIIVKFSLKERDALISGLKLVDELKKIPVYERYSGQGC